MTDTITADADTITPTLITGYTSQRAAGNIVHPILGASAPDVTLRPAQLRAGTLDLGFQGATAEADSKAAEDILGAAGVCALVTPDRPSMAMTFTVTGTIARMLDDETRDAWTVTVGYQEVNP